MPGMPAPSPRNAIVPPDPRRHGGGGFLSLTSMPTRLIVLPVGLWVCARTHKVAAGGQNMGAKTTRLPASVRRSSSIAGLRKPSPDCSMRDGPGALLLARSVGLM